MINFILPKFNFTVERWKWNKEYRIYVSNKGHFKDEFKRPIPLRISQSGYMQVPIDLNGKIHKPAHRLVMLTWKPIPNAESLTVDHLDHNKRHNALENLEWVTIEENQKRSQNDLIITEADRMKCLMSNKIALLKSEIEMLSKGKIVNNEFVIYAGSVKFHFHSFEEAARWIMKKQGMHENTNINKIKKDIFASIRTGNKYCKYNWQISFKIKED